MPNQQLARALTKALSPRPDAPGRQRKVVLLGVGSELRGDDAVGIVIARRLEALHLAGVQAMEGGTAPENLTGEIRQISPSHLIIVDSADMGEAPGTIRIIEPDRISGVSFGTHALPLNVLADYIAKEMDCTVALIGIQPRSLEFDAGLCPEVALAAEQAVQVLSRCLQKPTDLP